MRINAAREYITWPVVRRRWVVTLDLKRYAGHNYGGFEVSGGTVRGEDCSRCREISGASL